MGSHPLNLAIRFLLELTALAIMGYWGWKQGDGFIRFVLIIGIPLLAAVIWGTFNVLGDPSRSGEAPIQVAGILRLLIELSFFGIAAWMLYNLQYNRYAIIIICIVVLHYLVSYDRVLWLLSNK